MTDTTTRSRSDFDARTRWLARLALFALVFQIAALGHWNGSALSPAEQARHAQHCHGDSLACSSGLSSAVGDLVPVKAQPSAPVAQTLTADVSVSVPTEAFVPLAADPPRGA